MNEPGAYIICTSPRSGSTLLCNLLRDTGIAGHPKSYFHRPSLTDWRAGLSVADDASLGEVLTAARTAGQAGTPRFGLRLQRHSAPFFLEQLRQMRPHLPSDTDRIAATFGPTRYIHLTREDKVAQAVSLVRASQSGLWHRNADGSELERTGTAMPLIYDATVIETEHATLTGYDQAWQSWFQDQGITPLRITYRDLAADPAGQLARALTFLGADPSYARNIEPAVAQLSDATNAAWIAQFRGTHPDA